MKQIVVVLLSSLMATVSYTQDWLTIHGSDYEVIGFFTNGSGWQPGNKQFSVNPNDGSIWLGMDNEIHGFDASGSFFVFDYTNVPVLVSNQNLSTILDFGFAGNEVFAIDGSIGLLKYDGMDWVILNTQDEGNAISEDQDSVWVAYHTGGFVTWKDGFTSQDTFDVFERIVSRKGEIWGGGNYSTSLGRIVNGNYVSYNAASHPFLLDNTNYDFKFAHSQDTLYTVGEKGISLAYQGVFIDTLTIHNTINMPSESIQEIEFDKNNNFWALFGTSYDDLTSVGYYDQQTNTWSIVYDQNNSPINWSYRISIESDLEGNLYVHDRDNIYVLKVNNWPQWLDLEEEDLVKFDIYPNPSNGEFTILTETGSDISNIEIIDTEGRTVLDSKFVDEVIFSGSPGVYFVQLKSDQGILARRRIVIR